MILYGRQNLGEHYGLIFLLLQEGNNKPDKMNTVMMKNLLERWHLLRTEIEEAERQFGRIPGSVKLLAVSKTRDVADILALAQLGATDLGENYVQEAQAKIEQLSERPITWHYHRSDPVQQDPSDRRVFSLGTLR